LWQEINFSCAYISKQFKPYCHAVVAETAIHGTETSLRQAKSFHVHLAENNLTNFKHAGLVMSTTCCHANFLCATLSRCSSKRSDTVGLIINTTYALLSKQSYSHSNRQLLLLLLYMGVGLLMLLLRLLLLLLLQLLRT
jgi:hypothetical protein